TAHHTKALQTEGFRRSRGGRSTSRDSSVGTEWAHSAENVSQLEKGRGRIVACQCPRRDAKRASRCRRPRPILYARHPRAARASALERWLLTEWLAEPNGAPGQLVPTRRAFEIAGRSRLSVKAARPAATECSTAADDPSRPGFKG